MRIAQKLSMFVVVAALALACGGKDKPASTMPEGGGGGEEAAPKSLFDRLGGLPAITAVVDDFVANCAADERINARFANTDIPKLKTLLVEQICAATGGPCTYTGRDMKTTHAGMNVTEDEFTALVEDLVKALDKHNVPEAEKNELLGALGGMKGDIVGQ